MIDFACKQFDLNDVIRCSLGLTKTEFQIMKYLLKKTSNNCTTISVSKKLNLNLTTIQKAVKKLSIKKILLRHQKNLKNGGYVYTYECNLKLNIKNAQIAQALKKFNKKPTPTKKAKPKQKEKDEREPTTIKRKARILPPEEKEKKTDRRSRYRVYIISW